MKIVILAGGLGTRISEESHLRPKPMIEIGGAPILWHIMKYYSQFGYNEFIICCGYKGYIIKEYFANYYLHRSDITFDFSDTGIIAKVTVISAGKTGVEMEALVGVSTALLTIWDMVKSAEKDEKGQYPVTGITDIRVIEKIKRDL